MLWPVEKFGSFFNFALDWETIAATFTSSPMQRASSHSIECSVLTVQAAPDGFQLGFLLELHKQVLIHQNSRAGV